MEVFSIIIGIAIVIYVALNLYKVKFQFTLSYSIQFDFYQHQSDYSIQFDFYQYQSEEHVEKL